MTAILPALTDKRAAFARYVAQGHVPTHAATLAGFASPRTEAHRLMQQPVVLAALKRERERRIQGELAGLALNALHDILTDRTVSAAVRERASRTVLDYAGHSERNRAAADDGEKPINEMSADELQLFILRARAVVVAAEAPLIEGEATAAATPRSAGYELLGE